MKTALQYLAALVLLVATTLAPAELRGAPPTDGDNDPTFQDSGVWIYNVPSSGGEAIVAAPDGRLVIGYTATLSGTDKDMRIVPVADQGAAVYCGSYHPDLGGTDEDRVEDLVAHEGRLFLVGAAAGPPGDPGRQGAVGAFSYPGCVLDTSFGGGDGLILDAGAAVVPRALAFTDSSALRLATAFAEGSGTEALLAHGRSSSGGIDAGFPAITVDFAVAFGADHFETRGMVQQPDGKLVVVGTVHLPPGDRDVGVVRVLATGGLDPSFSSDGLASFSYQIVDSGADEGNAIALLPDGRIVVAGSVAQTGGSAAAVAVLTPAGAYASDFGVIGRYSFGFTDFSSESTIRALATQGDGRIVAVGSDVFIGGNGDRDIGVARLLPTGPAPLDTSFSIDGKRFLPIDEGGSLDDEALAVTLAPSGKISVSGAVATATGTAVAAVRLYNRYIFVDGFEAGRIWGWSAAQP